MPVRDGFASATTSTALSSATRPGRDEEHLVDRVEPEYRHREPAGQLVARQHPGRRQQLQHADDQRDPAPAAQAAEHVVRIRGEYVRVGNRGDAVDQVEAADDHQGRVSARPASLADCGYVQARRAGRFAYYTVADPRVADLVVLARSLAADNVSALADCVRIAQPRRGVSDSATALRHGQTQYDVARHRYPSELR